MALSLPRAPVPSLVRELRFHKRRGEARKKKERKQREGKHKRKRRREYEPRSSNIQIETVPKRVRESRA